ncbi:MAG TPA: metallophosphoesterase, partial [Polyangiaceae bacterium]|nr:metallophosphoesterase [Polyangiaceae bacterium]
MPRALAFFLFFAVALSLVGGVHYYIWARLVRDLALPAWAHRGLTLLVVVLCLSVPLTFWLGRRLPLDNTRPFMLVAFGWLGMVFLLLVLLGMSEVVRTALSLATRLVSDAPPEDPERRLALSRIFGASVALLAGGLGVAATYQGLGRFVVKQVSVALAR